MPFILALGLGKKEERESPLYDSYPIQLLENFSFFSKVPFSIRKLSYFKIQICSNQLLDPGQVT